MGPGVTGLFPQVVKLEGDLVVRVKEATITQISVLRYQDLQTTQEKPAVNSAIMMSTSDEIFYFHSGSKYFLKKELA